MTAEPAAKAFTGVRLFTAWTVFVLFCNVAGWTLSALHSLTFTGYIVAFSIFFGFLAFWLKKNPIEFPQIPRLKRRFSRPFPLAFAFLAALALLGGALHAPNNFDGLAYRTPRVLNWLAEGRWHWIHSHFGNLNTRGAGFEWVTAPLFLFTKTDRLEFLINGLCFLLLPGRFFSILTRLNVRPRVAYYWMWIFPTAYGFLLQAGSIGNDIFASIWPLAALEYALRARQTGQVAFAWLSILCASLMTASKAFNLLLLPAWAILILPSLMLLCRRWIGTVFILLISVSISIIPTSILNIRYCGDWTGLAAEPVRLGTGPPLFQLGVNLVLITLHNFAPPIFPFAGAWDRFVAGHMPPSLGAKLTLYFEEDAARLRIGELQMEESAGLGFGVSLLLLSIALKQLFSRVREHQKRNTWMNWCVSLAALAGGCVLLVKSGLYAPARYLLPQYFPMLIPLFASPAAAALVRARWWRALALLTFGMGAILLILSPSRPLFPAKTVFGDATSPLLQRAVRVYSTYAQRNDLLRPIRQAIPDTARKIGLISSNNPETSIYRPFGQRRIFHLRREDSPESISERGIEYIVIDVNSLQYIFSTLLADWLQKNNAEIVGEFPIQVLARAEPSKWVLVRLKP